MATPLSAQQSSPPELVPMRRYSLPPRSSFQGTKTADQQPPRTSVQWPCSCYRSGEAPACLQGGVPAMLHFHCWTHYANRRKNYDRMQNWLSVEAYTQTPFMV